MQLLPAFLTHTHALILTIVIYTVVIKMHGQYTGANKQTKNSNNKNNNQQLHSQQIGDHSRASADCIIAIFCRVTETWEQTSRGIPGFYSTSGAVDYTAVVFSVHLVARKCEFFTTTNTMEIELCARPATQLTRSPLLPANFTRQSTAHARKCKWKGSIVFIRMRDKELP